MIRIVAMECGLCRSGRRSARAEVRRRPGGNEFELAGTGRGGKPGPLGDQEPISCDAERGVMVEPTPVAAFKVSQAQFLFQLLVVPFDDPALFGHSGESFERGVASHRRQPVLSGFGFPPRPFDQQPLFRVWFGLPVVSMRRADSNCSKAGSQFPFRTFTPTDFPKGSTGQTHCQLLYCNGLMVRTTLQQPRRTSHLSSW